MTYEPSELTTPSNQMSFHHEHASYEERIAKQNETIHNKKRECLDRLKEQISLEGKNVDFCKLKRSSVI